ncbi:Protein of unknown function [Paenibacillus sp. GP183]|nr:Protein of unknown function [Paenibacillus sp. GP183]
MVMGFEVSLKDYHEDHWLKFVDNCSKSVVESEIEFGDISVPKDIAIVLNYRLRNHARTWLFKSVPALDNVKPIDLLNSEEGKNILRVALMRMPD